MESAALPCPRSIELVALDPARNIRRRYHIQLSIDLFGQFLVDYGWGRIGARGQNRRVSFGDRHAAERHVTALLRRRATAQARIGVAYRFSGAVASNIASPSGD